VSYDEDKSFALRYHWVIAFLVLLFLFLLFRMVQLTLYDRSFLEKQGNARSMRIIALPAFRGTIRDRFGEPLAMSVPMESIWVNPQAFSLTDPHLPELLSLIGEKKNTLITMLAHHDGKAFLYLKRQVSPALAEKILALKMPGVYASESYQREYPLGAMTAPIIGFTNIDNTGQEGIELAYDSWLEGAPGKEIVEKDLYGHVIAIKASISKAKPGKDLSLSIDNHAQYQAYNALKNAVIKNKAVSGSMVILDVNTGEILAMANYPAYNPNIRPKKRNDNYKNRVVTDVFEPGSTIKPFAVVNAIQSGKYHANSVIDTSPGYIYLDGKRVEDEHNLGVITLTDILAHSSNVGITKLTLSLPAQNLYHLLESVGFGSKTSINFPGESAGQLPYREHWSDFSLATLSFGYGLSVNTLQLAAAYAILAHRGVKIPVTLIKTSAPLATEQIIEPKVAAELVSMLESVVSRHGTANLGKIDGYTVSGKTGTVRIVGAHGYELHRHNGIFVGMVPAGDPKFVAAVIIRDPQAGAYLGGSVAAPVFSEVMSNLLHEYNIPQDNMPENNIEKK
jgi:cell division protein FtsI (penicillin-binding protein 3)